MNKKVIHTVSILATIVGTFKIFGVLSGIYFLTKLGETFAISPSPAPYSHLVTIDPSTVKDGFKFGCEDASGKIIWGHWTYHVRNSIPGPHRRGVVFLNYLNLYNKDRNNDDDLRFKLLTNYYFCHDGAMARAIGCPENVVAAVFSLPNSDIEKDRASRYPCFE